MNTSLFSEIELAPADPILGLTEAFNKDPNPAKVNLGVGVYQDETGKVPLLEVVRECALKWVQTETTKGYLPIDGIPAYTKGIQSLLFGDDSEVISEGRAVTIQALGGTGGLKVGADFIKKFFPQSEVWISDPSWENHRALFESAGFKVNTYPYYDAATHGLNFSQMIKSLNSLPYGSVVVLHASCHNPTGVDPTEEQWEIITDLFAHSSRKLIPFIDFAYQGFSQSAEEDAYSVRLFAKKGIPCLIANSFSKSFSLYRERVGGLTVLTSSSEESRNVLSQLKRVIRTNYSNPSSHGAQVVAMILGDPALRARWETELAGMRDRIRKMRKLFVQGLQDVGVKGDFSFITNQNGMFSFTGLSPEQVEKLRDEYSIYMVRSSRICVAAMNEKNVGYICNAIAATMK
jgi:aromatic-amino-acid transaminase